MTNTPSMPASDRKRVPLLYFLGFVFAVFIGILITVYVVAKRTHPVFLDAHGKPTNAETHDHTAAR